MKLLIGIMVLFAFSVARGQDISQNELPAEVMDAFQSEHSDAADVEWEKKDGLYQVEFEIDHIDYKMLIDASGEIVERREEILASKLPSAVMDALEMQYENREIDDVEKIERDGEEFYEIELDGLIDNKITITSDGQVKED